MNDRNNLPYAIQLDKEMSSLEEEKKHLDQIAEEKIDFLVFGSGNRKHTVYWDDIKNLELVIDIQKMVEIIQNKRRNLLIDKAKKFKEL